MYDNIKMYCTLGEKVNGNTIKQQVIYDWKPSVCKSCSSFYQDDVRCSNTLHPPRLDIMGEADWDFILLLLLGWILLPLIMLHFLLQIILHPTLLSLSHPFYSSSLNNLKQPPILSLPLEDSSEIQSLLVDDPIFSYFYFTTLPPFGVLRRSTALSPLKSIVVKGQNQDSPSASVESSEQDKFFSNLNLVGTKNNNKKREESCFLILK